MDIKEWEILFFLNIVFLCQERGIYNEIDLSFRNSFGTPK